MIKGNVKKKKQNYFPNNKVEKMIMEYREGNYSDSKSLEEIIKYLDLLIYAVINRYGFWRYYEYDDLVQEARISCLTCIRTYDPNKVLQKNKSVFSFFSNVIKRTLRFFTLNKNRKLYKETLVPPEYMQSKQEEKASLEMENFDVILNFIFSLKKYFKKKPRMFNLVVILEKYIEEISGFDFNPKDFVSYAKSFGYTPEYCKKFLKEIKDEKKNIIGES